MELEVIRSLPLGSASWIMSYEFDTIPSQIKRITELGEDAIPELIDDPPLQATRAKRNSAAEDILWHKRLGHVRRETQMSRDPPQHRGLSRLRHSSFPLQISPEGPRTWKVASPLAPISAGKSCHRPLAITSRYYTCVMLPASKSSHPSHYMLLKIRNGVIV
jgi:hypothetical protein